mgnify:CR=1 FL=1
MLASPNSLVAGHLDAAAVRALLDEHQAGAAGHGHSIWTLLTLEIFLRQQQW